jgi:polysaccharide export outer membrane protein
VLEIRIFNRPQLSRDAVRVDGHGVITMPLLEGDIQAACRTEKELARVIATRYLEYQKNPHVDVFVKEYNSQPVAVLGAVNKAGQFQLQRRIRLLELLALAGGPRERAGTSIHVVHSEAAEICSSSKPGVSEDGAANGLVSYTLRDTLHGKDKSNPYVRPGDIITLPEADQVYVIGSVASPKAIPLSGPLTVSQAIATAGGILPEARGKKVRIVRQGQDGKKEIYVDLKAIEKHGAEDVALQANDILDVPKPSGATKMLRDIVRTTAPSLTLLPLQVLRF